MVLLNDSLSSLSYLRQLVLRKRIPSRAPRRRWDSPLRALPGCCFPRRLGRRRLPPLRKWALHRCLHILGHLRGGRRSRLLRPPASLVWRPDVLVCVRRLASCLPSCLRVGQRRVQPGKGKELRVVLGVGLGLVRVGEERGFMDLGLGRYVDEDLNALICCQRISARIEATKFK